MITSHITRTASKVSAVLLALALAGAGMTGCSAGKNTSNTAAGTAASSTSAATAALPKVDRADETSNSQLVASLPASNTLRDPRTLTGVSVIKRMAKITPVTTNPQPKLPVVLTDADGHKVTVKDTSRILALDLFGSYTKTLEGLGMTNRIVGRTVSSDEPVLKDLPVVTPGGHTINVEAVLKLKPTLVIVDHSIGPRTAIDQIRAAGVTVVVMQPKHTIDSIAEDIENVADVVGLPEEGKKLAKRSTEEVVTDKAAIAKLAPKKKLRIAFLYARGTGGIFFILGKGSGAKDLIQGVGGIDVAAENNLRKAAPANAESLAKLNPDVFFMMTEGLASAGGLKGILARPGVAQTIAGQHKRIVAIPDGESLAFGPQTGELLLRTALALYAPDH